MFTSWESSRMVKITDLVLESLDSENSSVPKLYNLNEVI